MEVPVKLTSEDNTTRYWHGTAHEPRFGPAMYLSVLFFAAFAVLACQFVVPGYYHKFVEDAIYTPCYVTQFAESFRQGDYYPSWMGLCFGGYGSPVFIYYSPLLYFLAGLLNLGGLGIPAAITLLKLLALFAGALSLFYLVRQEYSDRAAILAALVYIFLPTGILDNYMINTPAGRLAYAWLPATLLAARNLVRGPVSRYSVALMACSYSGLILSHIATAFIFSPFIAAFGLWQSKKGSRTAGALRLAMGVGAGLCLSAVLLVPATLERSALQLNLLGAMKYFSDFRKPLIMAFEAPANEEVRHIWSLARNGIIIEVALAAVLYYILRRNRPFRLGGNGAACLWLLLAALFMMSGLSAPLWKYLPGMSLINFPVRFLPISAVFVSVLLGLMLDAFAGWENKPKGIVAGAAGLLLIVMAFDVLMVYRSLPPVATEKAERYFGRVDMVEYLPATADVFALYGLDGQDPVLSLEEALPGDSAEEPLLTSKDSFGYVISRWDYTEKAFAVESPEGAEVRVKTFYFPGWHVWIDGNEVPVSVEDKIGAMLIDVPAGKHEVRLRFSDTLPRRAGSAISILTLVALVLPYGRVRRAMRPRPPGKSDV